MLDIQRTPELMALHEAILGIAARARDGLDGDPFGSPYIRDLFSPHISLAKIDRDDQPGAAAIGLRTLGEPASRIPEPLTCATSVNAANDGTSWPASPPPNTRGLITQAPWLNDAAKWPSPDAPTAFVVTRIHG
jgi:hypothetical protein